MNLLLPIIGQRRRAGFDPDALDYFSRAEALGGSFDQTAINALYTESYIKKAISDCIAGLKTDAVWSKITELYLMSFVTFAGLMAKVKHAGTARLTNTNFVAGDYLAAGSGAGLTGDGSTSFLATGLLPASNIHESASLGFYRSDTTAPPITRSVIGARSGSIMTISELTATRYANQIVNSQTITAAGYDGIMIGSRVSQTDQRLFRNGSQIGTTLTTSAASATNSNDIYLFAQNRLSSGAFEHSASRLSSAFVGTGLTATEAANLSNRINTLMTAIGGNVF